MYLRNGRIVASEWHNERGDQISVYSFEGARRLFWDLINLIHYFVMSIYDPAVTHKAQYGTESVERRRRSLVERMRGGSGNGMSRVVGCDYGKVNGSIPSAGRGG